MNSIARNKLKKQLNEVGQRIVARDNVVTSSEATTLLPLLIGAVLMLIHDVEELERNVEAERTRTRGAHWIP